MNNPRFIYFTGIDGCGKSSVINELIKEYEQKGIKAKRVWLRFNYFFTRPVLLLSRIIGLTRREIKGGKVYSIHDFHKSKIMASTVQYLHFIDTVIAYFLKVWIPLKFGDHVILCDKFVYDILSDFMLETKDLSVLDKRIAKFFLSLLPKKSPVIFLAVDKAEIIKRKPEVLVDDEDYDLKYKIYELIMNKYGFHIINNVDMEKTLLSVRKIIHFAGEINCTGE